VSPCLTTFFVSAIVVWLGLSYLIVFPRSLLALSKLATFPHNSFSNLCFHSVREMAEDGQAILPVVLFTLSVAALPFTLAHWWLIERWHEKPIGSGGDNHKNLVPYWKTELWIAFWAAFNLFVTLRYVDAHPWLILFAGFRLADLLHIFVERRSLNKPAYNRGRALTLLVFHYFEIVTIFAAWFGFLQHRAGDVFCDSSKCPLHLSWGLLIYYAGVTGATLGYGDIVPCKAALQSHPLWLNPSIYILFQLFCGIVLTVLELPQPKESTSTTQGTKDGGERTDICCGA